MSESFDVSVVISTYNRCGLLPAALESVLAQDAPGVAYEVVLVDNNSTDETRRVVEEFIARGHRNLRYFFEPKQGLSHGWNRGIAEARGRIIAFTDDDIRVRADWVANIKRTFDEHPEVDFVGSRVLPVWPREPPRWLTPENWSPLALQDYGETARPYSNLDNPICLLGKSFRREAFKRVGLFRPDLGRVKDGVGSLEDSDMQQRLWRAGRQGIHAPDVVMYADVQPERMTRDYHRRWHTGHGRFYAVMRDEDFEASASRLFDVPAHLYKQAAVAAVNWLRATLRGDSPAAAGYEARVRFFVGFFKQRRADYRASRPRRNTFAELFTFAGSLARSRREAAGRERG